MNYSTDVNKISTKGLGSWSDNAFASRGENEIGVAGSRPVLHALNFETRLALDVVNTPKEIKIQ